MTAYVISDLSRIDGSRIREYLALSRPSVEAFGGEYLASSAQVEMLEGEPTPTRIVIVRFESMEKARAWYASADYADALQFGRETLTRRLMIVDGSVD